MGSRNSVGVKNDSWVNNERIRIFCGWMLNFFKILGLVEILLLVFGLDSIFILLGLGLVGTCLNLGFVMGMGLGLILDFMVLGLVIRVTGLGLIV